MSNIDIAKLNVGKSKVKLIGGNIHMTVISVDDSSNSVECKWVDKASNDVMVRTFSTSDLMNCGLNIDIDAVEKAFRK